MRHINEPGPTTPSHTPREGAASMLDLWQSLRAPMFAHNKAAVFDALTEFGVNRLVIEFDGAAGSGQIEDIYDEDNPKSEIEGQVALQTILSWDATEPETETVDLRSALEELAYELLDREQSGWENGAGAVGRISLCVAPRDIVLDFNTYRDESSHHSRQVF